MSLRCDHFAVCMTTSCCDFDFLVAIMLVVLLPTCLTFMSQPHFDVATSFDSHFFSSGCNMFYVATHFLLLTYFPGRDLNLFCSALVQVATPLSGGDIISNP